MGKKDKAEMAKQQARFVEGAVANGVKRDDADLDLRPGRQVRRLRLQQSHAAAYALVSYQTAYLKANFREEFFAASMTLDMGNTDKLAMFASEARKSAASPCCRPASTRRASISARAAEGRSEARRHPLLAGRAEEHRRAARSRPSSTSATPKGLSRRWPISRAASTPRR